MKEGDFVEIDFIGTVEGTGEVFDLTIEEEAKKRGLQLSEGMYKPQLVIIGSGMIVPGVDEELKGMNVGEEKEFTIPPEKGFGFRNPANIKIISEGNFKKENVNPVPGSFVEINGRRGRVQSAASGRVRIDFNHPLAGKSLHYWMKITTQITEPREKAAKLMEYYNMKCTAEISDKKLLIKTEQEVPKELRQLIMVPLQKWIPEIKEIVFATKKKPTEAGASETKTQEKTIVEGLVEASKAQKTGEETGKQ